MDFAHSPIMATMTMISVRRIGSLSGNRYNASYVNYIVILDY